MTSFQIASELINFVPIHAGGGDLWPAWEDVQRIVSLRDHNTRVVLFGVMCLGLASGVVGTFMLLRKRSLMGDAVSHATFPGIGLAFLVMVAAGGTGKYVPGLLLGALVTGVIGMGTVLFIRGTSRLKEDAALGIVLSVFFGAGSAVFGVIQNMNGAAAGLNDFIYGRTASMVVVDAQLIAITAIVVVVVCALLYKEFRMLCFDQGYAAAQGWPVVFLDTVMMLMVVIVTVIGLQAVGLILVVAMLIVPAAAARFWTEQLLPMLVISATIGMVSGVVGAGVSGFVPDLPAGAVIVLTASICFLFSFVFGSARGLARRGLQHMRLGQTIARQNLLRTMYEWWETQQNATAAGDCALGIGWDLLLAARSWSPRRLRRSVRRSLSKGLVYEGSDHLYHFTEVGMSEARRIVRNHRLWEFYLITHAEIAPARVDRDADRIEHVLGHEMVDRLEELLAREYPQRVVPPSPHELDSFE
jgi:manganese/zinc/iron transport system permease protein